MFGRDQGEGEARQHHRGEGERQDERRGGAECGVGAIEKDGDGAGASKEKPAAAPAGNSWNYKTTGDHVSVHRLPTNAPVVPAYRLGGNGNNKTGILSEP